MCTLRRREGGREGKNQAGMEGGREGLPELDDAVAEVEDVEGVIEVLSGGRVNGEDAVRPKVTPAGSEGGREGEGEGGREECASQPDAGPAAVEGQDAVV